MPSDVLRSNRSPKGRMQFCVQLVCSWSFVSFVVALRYLADIGVETIWSCYRTSSVGPKDRAEVAAVKHWCLQPMLLPLTRLKVMVHLWLWQQGLVTSSQMYISPTCVMQAIVDVRLPVCKIPLLIFCPQVSSTRGLPPGLAPARCPHHYTAVRTGRAVTWASNQLTHVCIHPCTFPSKLQQSTHW